MERTIICQLKRGELSTLFRQMSVGDIIRLPIEKHASARSMIANNLLVERANGCAWSVRADLPNKQTIVIRTK